MGTSPTTGEQFYSGDWTGIKNICEVLNIGEGKLSRVNQQMVEFFQEHVDRLIDADLNEYYETPLKPFKQYMPARDEEVSTFPGNVRHLAMYWTAGLLLTSEFQDLDANANAAAVSYVEESRRQLFQIVRFHRRLQGQEMKHKNKTVPPTMWPAATPDPDF